MSKESLNPFEVQQKLVRETKCAIYYRCYSYNCQCSSDSSVTQLCPTLWNPWTTEGQASLSITNSQSLLKLMVIESVMPSNHLILCRPLLLLPSVFPNTRVFSNESVLCIRWAKYWSFSFGKSPSNEYSGLISFRMDWLDLLAFQGTPKSLLQHHSSKASILQHSAFFMGQLSHYFFFFFFNSHIIYDYWKKHSLDYMDLCWQSNVSVF